MSGKVIIVKRELPLLMPQGWKQAVARKIGVHPKSMSRILKHKTQPNFGRAMEAAKEMYGKIVNNG